MSKTLRILFIGVLFLLLIVMRAVFRYYLYDPLAHYFDNDYLHAPIPVINYPKFFTHLFLRYFINSSISVLILHFAFSKLKIVLFTVKFYLLAFVLLSSFLFFLIYNSENQGYILIFYVRRFLIHPLFLLILFPAFYYQKLKLSEKIKS